MAVILGVWGFAMFLWTKIMFELLFWEGITVLGAFLIGVVFMGYIFAFSGVMAKIFLPINLNPGMVEADIVTIIGKSLIPFVVCAGFFGVLSRLIILGFSERLSNGLTRWYHWDWSLTESAVNFGIIIGVPCLIHYVMCIFPTYANRRKGD